MSAPARFFSPQCGGPFASGIFLLPHWSLIFPSTCWGAEGGGGPAAAAAAAAPSLCVCCCVLPACLPRESVQRGDNKGAARVQNKRRVLWWC